MQELFGISNRTARQMSLYIYKPEIVKWMVSISDNGVMANNEILYNATNVEQVSFQRIFKEPFTELVSSPCFICKKKIKESSTT